MNSAMDVLNEITDLMDERMARRIKKAKPEPVQEIAKEEPKKEEMSEEEKAALLQARQELMG